MLFILHIIIFKQMHTYIQIIHVVSINIYCTNCILYPQNSTCTMCKYLCIYQILHLFLPNNRDPWSPKLAPAIPSLCDSLPRALPMSLRVAATSGRSAPKCRSSIFKTRSKKSFFVRGSPKAPWALPMSLRVAATSGWSGPSGRLSHTEGIAGASFEDWSSLHNSFFVR